jgi:Ca2+-binding RTX toxin-like protein
MSIENPSLPQVSNVAFGPKIDAGTFTYAGGSNFSYAVRFLQATDLNGDGTDEIIFAGFETQYNTPENYTNTNISVFGWQNGVFKNLTNQWLPGNINRVQGVGDITFGDFNGDDLTDIYLAGNADMNYQVNSYALINQGGYFSRQDFGLTEWEHASFSGDINNDGYDDVVVAGYLHPSVFYMGSAAGLVKHYVSDSPSYAFNSYETHGSGVAVGDFLGHGTVQVLITDAATATNSADTHLLSVVFDGEGTPVGFRFLSTLPTPRLNLLDTPKNSHDIRARPIDFDNDGSLDVLVFSYSFFDEDGANPHISEIQFLKNEGNGVFSDVTDLYLLGYDTSGYVSYNPQIGDFNSDGLLDIFSSTQDWFDTPNSTTLLLQNNDGFFIDTKREAFSALIPENGGQISLLRGPNDQIYALIESQTFGGSTSLSLSRISFNYAPTGTVTITGTPTQGQVLTAANTLADVDGMGAVSYQWKADGTSINGATSSTFTLTQSQVGKAITVVASYTDQLSNAESVASGATSRVSTLNYAPTTKAVLATTKEDTALTLSSSLFSFSDANKTDKLQSVTISALPSHGTLLLNGTSVSADQSISIADINAKRLSYTPSANGNGAGFDTLSFKVSDGKELSSSALMTFNVTAVNDAPTVANAIANQSATEGSAFNFTLPNNIFADIDSGALVYKATLANGKALPKWLTFNVSTGTFTGTPADADSATTLSIKVVATDSGKLFTSDIFDLAITGVNVAPVGHVLAAVSATEGKLFTYNLPKAAFTDGDRGDLLTYSSTNLPGWLTINSATGKITGTPDYAAADSSYITVSITATDRVGLSDTEDLRINLKNTPTITGTALANTLTGGNGVDTIKAGAGDDTLSGASGNDILWGEAGNDILLGGIGLDTLIGGLGNDLLTGGEGNDIFLFNSAISAQNIDTITDFTSGDQIQLSQSIFKGLTKGALTNTQFYSAPGATTAQDGADRIIYDQSSGALYYDADGIGTKAAPIQIALIGSTEHPALQASDLWVV